MSYTFNEAGHPITETQQGISLPTEYTFAAINDFIHLPGVHFEELQALCLGLANNGDQLRARVAELELELKTTDILLEHRNGVLRAIPECRAHGNQCIPGALEWIENAKAAICRVAELEADNSMLRALVNA